MSGHDVGHLPGSDRAYRLTMGTASRLVKTLLNVDVIGLDNVPSTGAAILAPNHLSFCDSVLVPSVLDRRVWYIGKGEYMNDWKTKRLFPAMGMIPIDRSGGDAAQMALDTAARVLDEGHLFSMYPEGTRSRSGHLHKGRTGAARLAVRCNVPIIPVGVIGTPDIQPPGSVIPRPFKKARVAFGTPMRAEQFGDPDDPRLLRVFTDALMYEISQISEQTYVDHYAGDEPKPKPEVKVATGPVDDLSAAPTPDGSSPGQPTKRKAMGPVGAAS